MKPRPDLSTFMHHTSAPDNALNLTLEPLSHQWLQDVHALRSDSRVIRYIRRELACNLQQTTEFIDRILGDPSKLFFVILQNGVFAGTIGLKHIDVVHRRAEVGYELLPSHWRQGIMHWALMRVCTFGSERLQLQNVVAMTHCQNVSSILLLERCGFERTQLVDPDVESNVVFVKDLSSR